MAKKIYLITHGDRSFGPNPTHTKKGIEQLKALQVPGNVSLVVVGTGDRFQEILKIIDSKLGEIPIKYSPFCGSADGLEADGNIILVNGKLVNLKNDYVSISNSPAFNPWEFIDSFPDNTLLCAGGELMITLGLKSINEKGQLYELHPENKMGGRIN